MKNEKLRNLEGKLHCNVKIYNLKFEICNPRRRCGFTLIELIIVLFIIGVALGLVGILVHRGSSELELKTFTKDVSATLRYARSHAITEKKFYSFIILKDKEAYGLYADFSINEDFFEEATPVVYKTIPKPLQIIFENRAEYLRIDFFPQGNSSGGIVEITNQKGKTFFIIVNKVTGRVGVKRIQNSK
jgi:general secretion pathway protein H